MAMAEASAEVGGRDTGTDVVWLRAPDVSLAWECRRRAAGVPVSVWSLWVLWGAGDSKDQSLGGPVCVLSSSSSSLPQIPLFFSVCFRWRHLETAAQ